MALVEKLVSFFIGVGKEWYNRDIKEIVIYEKGKNNYKRL